MGDKFDIHDGGGLTKDEINLLLATIRAEFREGLVSTLTSAKMHADERDVHMKGNIMQHITSTGAMTEFKITHLERTLEEHHGENKLTLAENAKDIRNINKYLFMGLGALAALNVVLRFVHL